MELILMLLGTVNIGLGVGNLILYFIDKQKISIIASVISFSVGFLLVYCFF